jgi:hypothetical protein
MDPVMLGRLAALATVLQDQRLEILRQAQQRKQATEALIAGLDAPSPCDLSLVSAGQAEMAYRLWTEGRKRALRHNLQQQIADCDRATAAARQAFGKAQVLAQLVAGQSPSPK